MNIGNAYILKQSLWNQLEIFLKPGEIITDIYRGNCRLSIHEAKALEGILCSDSGVWFETKEARIIGNRDGYYKRVDKRYGGSKGVLWHAPNKKE